MSIARTVIRPLVLASAAALVAGCIGSGPEVGGGPAPQGISSPVGVTGVTPPRAPGAERRLATLEGRMRESELIVQGVVRSVSYALAEPAEAGGARLPHTFVTLQVERVFKGQSPGPTLTLRLFGGRTASGEYMVSSAVPLFDAGERSILFVRGNGVVKHPIVGWHEGRLRVVEGRVYSDGGREVQLVAGAFRLGAHRAIEEVYTHRIAGTDQVMDTRALRDLRPAITGDEDRADPSAPLAPQRPESPAGAVTVEDFAAWLDQSVARAHSAAALAALPVVRSADPTARFVGPSFRPVALSSAARE